MIDVLVLGTGRSGTSNTCKVIHSEFGVCFGHAGVGQTDKRGEIIWEDADTKKWLKEVLGGRQSADWLHQKVLSQHKPHGCKLIGLKLLDLCLLSHEDLRSFEPSLIVRTFRPRESCIQSWLRPEWRGPRETAEWKYDRREAKLIEIEQNLPDVRTLFYDPEQRRISDGEILERIGPWTSGS